MNAILLFVFFLIAGVSSCWADPADCRKSVENVQQRLTQTEAFYTEGKKDEAKAEIQAAYFGDFESIEGAIRINISAQKSREMEAAFGEIRKMISGEKPQAEIADKIQWLRSELTQVLPVLEGGHALAAEQVHGTGQDDAVLPFWQEWLKKIDDLLAESVTLYQEGKLEEAQKKVLRAQYEGYKNSGLETAVRLHRSAKDAADLNDGFLTLVLLTKEGGKLNEYGYELSMLLQRIADRLPGLPLLQTADAGKEREAQEPSVPESDWGEVVDKINRAIADAIAQYGQGKVKPAVAAVQDSYFDLFEASGMENRVGARDAAVKSTLEGYFTRMVSLMQAGQPVSAVQEQALALQGDLAPLPAMLGKGSQSHWNLFIYSLLIIVREGLEALLIVAAIVAYLVKSGHGDKLRMIRQSVVAALVASVVTAAVFQWVLSNSGASREVMEGATMLLAVGILFYMSYWLLAKTETRRWKEYLESKIAASLSAGSLVGLWLCSFLAVYREGAETALFYYALLGDANGTQAHAVVLGGFLVGSVLLVAAYFLMRYSVVKLPLKPFFWFTSLFMYLMAFVFAGKGVLELIEGKLFKPTLVSWVPDIDWLGIHPYRETLFPQILLLIGAVIALWAAYRRPRTVPSRANELNSKNK